MFRNLEITDITDCVISFNYSKTINQDVNEKIHQIFKILISSNIEGLISSYPTYTELVIRYDPQLISRKNIIEKVSHIEKNFESKKPLKQAVFNIPVKYGGNYGPDLKNVSEIIGIPELEVIKIHTQNIYHVFMIGFSPGFPYLGGLDKRLECPRLATPRIKVNAGSVAIAGNQTGVYPSESSGGWRIIGKTEIKLFDLSKNIPSILSPGMKIKFVSI